MSQLLIVPTNENGLILDTQIAADINTALSPPFDFNDVYVYAHGWWTSPQRAMQDYNQFTVGYARSVLTALAGPAPADALGIGVQWQGDPIALEESCVSLRGETETNEWLYLLVRGTVGIT